jgi:tetratricopeptide (TPR) repeat protein
VLLLLVAFAAAATVQARRLARARAIAVSRQGQAEELIGFMLGDLRTRLEPIGKLDLLDDVGGKALAYFAAVPQSELTDEELYRRAQALQQLGDVRLSQGKVPEAAALMRESLRLSRTLASRDSLNPRWQLGLAHSDFAVGSIDWQQGNSEAALSHFEPFVRISDRLLARFPDSLNFRAERAYALNNIGFDREAKGDVAGALVSYLAALHILRDLVQRQPANKMWRLSLSLEHNAVAVAQRKLGDLPGALANQRADLAAKEGLLAEAPTDGDLQRFTGIARSFLSDMHLSMGNTDSALTHARASRDLFASLVKRDTSNARWAQGLVKGDRIVAQALDEGGDAEGALRELVHGRTLGERLLLKSPTNPRLASELAMTETARARALLHLGREIPALEPARRAVALSEESVAKKPGDIDRRMQAGDASLILGEILARAHDASGATAARTRALGLVDSLARATRQTDLLALQASTLLELGRTDDARPIVAELSRRGYRRPSFLERLRQGARREGLTH